MSDTLTAQAAIQQALLQLGVYDPGEQPSTSEQNDCLAIANQMLSGWYNEQAQAFAVLMQLQADAAALFIGDQAKKGAQFIAQQTTDGTNLKNQQQENAAPLAVAYVLAAGTYASPSYTAASYTPPSYTAGTFTPSSPIVFPDLTTLTTFPEGYGLAIVLNLAIKLAPQYPGVAQVSPQLMDNAMKAYAAANPMPGRVPIPGTGWQGTISASGPATSPPEGSAPPPGAPQG